MKELDGEHPSHVELLGDRDRHIGSHSRQNADGVRGWRDDFDADTIALYRFDDRP